MWRGEVFAISDCLVPYAVNGSQGLKSVLMHYTFQHRVISECGLLWASRSGLLARLHEPSPDLETVLRLMFICKAIRLTATPACRMLISVHRGRHVSSTPHQKLVLTLWDFFQSGNHVYTLLEVLGFFGLSLYWHPQTVLQRTLFRGFV